MSTGLWKWANFEIGKTLGLEESPNNLDFGEFPSARGFGHSPFYPCAQASRVM